VGRQDMKLKGESAGLSPIQDTRSLTGDATL